MYGGKLGEDYSCFVRFVCTDPSRCQCSVSSDNGRTSLGMGKGKGDCF